MFLFHRQLIPGTQGVKNLILFQVNSIICEAYLLNESKLCHCNPTFNIKSENI